VFFAEVEGAVPAFAGGIEEARGGEGFVGGELRRVDFYGMDVEGFVGAKF